MASGGTKTSKNTESHVMCLKDNGTDICWTVYQEINISIKNEVWFQILKFWNGFEEFMEIIKPFNEKSYFILDL